MNPRSSSCPTTCTLTLDTKKPRLTKADMLARARKPLSRVSNAIPMKQRADEAIVSSTVTSAHHVRRALPFHEPQNDTPSISAPLESLLNSTLENCSAIMTKELENMRLEYSKLRKEKEFLQSQCVQAKYERDVAISQLQDLVGESRRGLKRKACGGGTEPLAPPIFSPQSRALPDTVPDKMALSNVLHPAGPGIRHNASAAPPSRQASAKLVTEHKVPPLPKLELSHVQAMYYQSNDRVHCCVCLMQVSGSQTKTSRSSPQSFAVSGLTLDDLVKHCVFAHPMSYSDVTGLTIEQVKELQKRLKPLA